MNQHYTPKASRRKFLITSSIVSAGLTFSGFDLLATDPETEALLPHYHETKALENDLRKHIIFGENPIRIVGNVYDDQKRIVKNAEIQIWHNDDKGRFHPDKFRGRLVTNFKGQYLFKTYKPGKYIHEKGHKMLNRAFMLVKAKDFEPQLNTLYFNLTGANIDGATYERSGIIPRPSLPTAKMHGSELVVTYDIYLKKGKQVIEEVHDKEVSLVVYPNPTTSNAYIDIDGELLGDVSITIFNLGGQQVQSIEVPNQGRQTTSLPIQNLQAGVYIIHINSAQIGIVKKKLVIRR